MGKNMFAAALAALALAFAFTATAGVGAPAKVRLLANSQLKALGTERVVVEAVKKANAKQLTPERIKELDAEWVAAPDLTPFMRSLMENDCGKFLRELRTERPYLAEVFVMDNRGATVAMSRRTTDYWQGDEPKWQESYKGGKGAVFIDEIKLDDSAKSYTAQVSVPVVDGKHVIGAMTFSVDVDQVR